jgi:hypothetical protein
VCPPLQVEQGEGFRSSKFDHTRHAMSSLASEIAVLDARKQELLAQLRQVGGGRDVCAGGRGAEGGGQRPAPLELQLHGSITAAGRARELAPPIPAAARPPLLPRRGGASGTQRHAHTRAHKRAPTHLQVDEEMSRLHKKQLDLEEERNMFEEGNDLVLEGLVASLRGLHAASVAEATRGQAYRCAPGWGCWPAGLL